MAATHDDRDLAARMARRDPAAWDALLEAHGGFLSAVALRACGGDSARADDVIGEVFLALLRDDSRLLRRFSAPYSLRALLAVVARRAAARGANPRTRAGSVPEQATREAAVIDVADRRERHAALREAIEELPARERACVRLAFEEGLSQRRIAERAGMPVNSVGKTLARALDRLRGKMPAAT